MASFETYIDRDVKLFAEQDEEMKERQEALQQRLQEERARRRQPFEEQLIAVESWFNDEQGMLDTEQEREYDQHYEHRLARLRERLEDLMVQTKQRWKSNKRVHRKSPYEWLVGKWYEETFRDDYGPESNKLRGSWRFTALLQLAGGDLELLEAEYTNLLHGYFPVEDEDFQWTPVFVTEETVRRKMPVTYLRVKHEARPVEAES